MDKHSEVQDANVRAEGKRRYEGFSMDTWRQGFKSMNEIFSWVRTSRFFVPSRMTSIPKDVVRRKTRNMYKSLFAHSLTFAEAGALGDHPALDPAAAV